ncbi:DUF4299 family protein [Corynebacterium nasicanis]|uniref:DUF4299 family protein n=1 Tax=Corynebacterium nasicanis TaxID=1448267 RepID=A0ABW1Q782_9CORY
MSVSFRLPVISPVLDSQGLFGLLHGLPIRPVLPGQEEPGPLEGRILRLGWSGDMGRGIEVTVEDGHYDLRVFTPSTLSDWATAAHVASALARHQGQSVVLREDGNAVAPDFSDVDVRGDIAYGLESVGRIVDKHEKVELPGAVRQVQVTAADVAGWGGDPEEFSRWFATTQDEDLFDPTPMFAQFTPGESTGVIVLSAGVETVFPVEEPTSPDYPDVAEWMVLLYAGDEREAGRASVAHVVSHLQPDKFRVLHAGAIVIRPLSMAELEALSQGPSGI